MARTMTYNPEVANPLGAVVRLSKYLKKGFSVSPIEMLKIMFHVQSLGIKTYNDLQKHLEKLHTENLNPIKGEVYTLIRTHNAGNESVNWLKLMECLSDKQSDAKYHRYMAI
jgi:hypothetical protein